MSFQHTTLLECNREQSVQRGVEGDNHAIFTNRMGKVVELDVGDTVSVKSAFINKRGSANPNSIEFKGQTIGVNVSFQQTATASENPTTFSYDNQYPTIFLRSTDLADAGSLYEKPYVNGINMATNNPTMNDIAFKQIFNEEVNKDIKDNEMYLETEYYRNADGGNYTFLPRMFKRTDGLISTDPTVRNFYSYENKNTQYWERCDFDWDLVSFGEPSAVAITNPGTGYTNQTNTVLNSGDIKTLSGTGDGISFTITIADNHLHTLTAITGGAGYRVGDTIAIEDSIIGGGSGMVLTISAVSDIAYEKGICSGICRYQPDLSIASGLMQNIQNGLLRGMLMADYHFVGQGITYGPNTGENPQPQTKETKEFFVDTLDPNNKRESTNDFSSFKPKHDGSRFFLFEREYDWLQQPVAILPNPETGSAGEIVPFYNFLQKDGTTVKITGSIWFNNLDAETLPDDFPVQYTRLPARSPALFPYIRRRDVNHIVVDKGYSTPVSISQQITNQCQEQSKDSPYFQTTQNAPGVSSKSPQGTTNYTTNVETGFYKPIVSSTLKGGPNYFVDITTEVQDDAFDFWKAHHNILIKRPDLYEAGTKINNSLGYVCIPSGQLLSPPDNPRQPNDNNLQPFDSVIPNFIRNEIKYTDRIFNNTTDPIITSWVYTETNLKLLSELFDAQGKYPELFYDDTKEFNENRPFMNLQYPDFNPDGSTPAEKFGDLKYGTPARITNSRFLHMNRYNTNTNSSTPTVNFDGGNGFDALGNDGYVPMTYDNGLGTPVIRTFDADHRSMPVFFRYMPEFRNIETTGTDETRLSYGFATKTRVAEQTDPTQFHDFITLHPELVNGIRPEAFINRGGMQPFDNTTAYEPDRVSVWDPGNISPTITDENDRFGGITIIGWDHHFTSWGNLFMIQQDGLAINSFDGVSTASAPVSGNFYNDNPSIDISSMIDQSYIGTNNIACNYDEVSNRFGWEYLHNPIFEGNPEDAGSTDFKFVKEDGNEVPTAQTSVDINTNAGKEVYKVNPRPYKWVWNNDLAPYIVQTGVLDSFNQGETKGRVELNPMNNNFVPWKIYDSQCGVAVDFGKTVRINSDDFQLSQEEAWNRSLLGILGFSYEQFNPEVVDSNNNSSARVSNRNVESLSFPSTNCRPKGTDTNLYVMNEYGAVQYNTQMPYALKVNIIGMDVVGDDPAEAPRVYNLADTGFISKPLEWLYLPPVVIATESIVIEAKSLPRVALFPYMTIRSDIITPQKYIGGPNSGLSLPVISVINKINADKDFIQMEGSADTYMITEPTSFSSITTAIMDPDGTLSLLDEGSAVIYKITKADNLSRYNIVAEFEKLLNKK